MQEELDLHRHRRATLAVGKGVEVGKHRVCLEKNGSIWLET